MAKLGDIATKIRSKNAGPFWLTVDIFCGSAAAYDILCDTLKTVQVAEVFDAPAESLKRFEIGNLKVLKFSLPRPDIQGSIFDRDMHGASWAALLGDSISIPDK